MAHQKFIRSICSSDFCARTRLCTAGCRKRIFQPSVKESVDIRPNPEDIDCHRFGTREGAKQVLKYAGEEAERRAHRQIGTKHLFPGLLDEEGRLAVQLLNGSRSRCRQHAAATIDGGGRKAVDARNL
jgi:hypothetical protein